MAYYPDLSPYRYFPSDDTPVAVNIGWLSGWYPFRRGKVPLPFLERLREFCIAKVMSTRGFHSCGIGWCKLRQCSGLSFLQSQIHVDYKNQELRLGSAEIRVFGLGAIVYAAPNLIYHYVSAHQYRPPEEFVQAVLTSPLPSSQEYQQRAQEQGWGQEMWIPNNLL